jgi:hypothetical protein
LLIPFGIVVISDKKRDKRLTIYSNFNLPFRSAVVEVKIVLVDIFPAELEE